MVTCISNFVNCCYVVHWNAITTSNLQRFQQHLTRFHDLQNIFITTGACKSVSLPHQHALLHYLLKIELFASPNGFCSMLTESKHKPAVKEPWQHSSHYNPLLQMVRTISQLDKLSALCSIFHNCGMLDGTISQYISSLANSDLPDVLPYGIHNKDDSGSDNDNDIDDNGGPLSNSQVLAQVTLATIHGL
jgi:hypothetical protein